MANKKISELTAVVTLPDAALITAVDLTRAAGDQNVKIAKSDLITGGGGAVDSVNTQIGVVVLDTDDIADTATNRYTNDTDVTRLANTSGTNTGNEEGDRATITNVIPITNIAGSNYNFNTANTETAYTVTRNSVINQWCQTFINTLTKPTLTLGGVTFTEVGGIGWTASTDLYLYLRDLGVDGIHYSFLPKAVGSGGGTFNLTVADSVATSVANVDDISFGAGFIVTDDGGGQAGVTFSGGGGSLPFLNIEDAPYNCVADALGDAGVDSTVGFELALSDLVAAGGGTLIIPYTPGLRFNITPETATTRDYSNITITSFVSGNIFIKQSQGVVTQGRGVLINIGTGTDNFKIENLDILVSSGAFRNSFNTGVICSSVGLMSNITIRNNVIKNQSKTLTDIGVDGINFYRITNGADTDIVNNVIIEDNTIELYGISIYGIHSKRQIKYLSIRRNTIDLKSWVNGNSAEAFNAIAVYGDCIYFVVAENTVLGSGHSGIAASMSSEGVIRDNFVFNVIRLIESGIEIEYKTDHGTSNIRPNGIKVLNNYVENCTYGIWVTERAESATTLAPYNVLINGNTVKDSIDADILIASSTSGVPDYTSRIKNITIKDNHLESTANTNIRIYDTDGCKIINNYCDGATGNLIIGRDSTKFPVGDYLISGNSFLNATLNSAVLFESTGANLYADINNNIIKTSANIYGIRIDATIGTEVTLSVDRNKISDLGNGIRFNGSFLSSITNNYAFNCQDKGFELAVVNGNFINNTASGCFTASTYSGAGSYALNNKEL